MPSRKILNQKREPLWLVVSGRNASEVARRLDAVLPALKLPSPAGRSPALPCPDALWPRPEFQAANRANARQLAAELDAFRRRRLDQRLFRSGARPDRRHFGNLAARRRDPGCFLADESALRLDF